MIPPDGERRTCKVCGTSWMGDVEKCPVCPDQSLVAARKWWTEVGQTQLWGCPLSVAEMIAETCFVKGAQWAQRRTKMIDQPERPQTEPPYPENKCPGCDRGETVLHGHYSSTLACTPRIHLPSTWVCMKYIEPRIVKKLEGADDKQK